MKPRSLWPREHGAYAELGLPVAFALISGRPTWRAFALAFAAMTAFLATEPLLVALGRRGQRHRGDRRALLWASALIVLAVSLAGAAMDATLARASAIPVALCAVGAVLIVLRRDRTLPGETLLSTALASAAIPVAVASSIDLRDAISTTFVWGTGFVAATIAVRGVIASVKHKTPPSRTTAAVACVPLLAAGLAAMGALRWWTVLAATPLVLVATVIAIRPPAPRALRSVGWTLVAATVATGTAIFVLGGTHVR
jgi:hypothetical protein